MKCPACGDRPRWIRDLCSLCLTELPYETRTAYRAGLTDTRRVLELLELRRTPAGKIGAGRPRSER